MFSDDNVYMQNDIENKEYISNDVGKLWLGTTESMEGLKWIFGQFDEDVLHSICVLLERSQLPPHERGDAVKMSRSISALVISLSEIKTN
jgi:hypothetical protein